jgi:hypothetical protein
MLNFPKINKLYICSNRNIKKSHVMSTIDVYDVLNSKKLYQ